MESNKDLKIFIGHGELDQVILCKASQESYKPIENFKGLSKFIYPKLGHSFTLQEVTDIKNFLTKCILG